MVLRVPKPANEAVVLAALAELLGRNMIELEADLPLGWPGQPLSTADLADRLTQALSSPRLSAEEARQRLGL